MERKSNQYIKVGISVVDISPKKGIELCGYAARSGGNTGILDNVYVKTIAIDDGNKKAALISCDLLGLDFEIISSIKNKAKKELGLDTKALMIASIHTHSGPVTIHNNGIGLKDDDYIKFLKEKLWESISTAFTSMEPADAYYYQGTCDIGINRRGRIEEGSIEPSADPNGIIDRQVSVIAFYRLENNGPFSVFFNFGCHPVVLEPENNLVSADFPGAACSFIEKSFNGRVKAIFTNGSAGNINPILRGSENEVKINGEKLGSAVMDILKTKGSKLDPFLSYDVIEVILPYAQPIMKEEFQKTLAEYNEQRKKTKPGSVEEKLAEANINWANKYLDEISNGKIPDYLQIYLYGLRIGNLSLIGIPAEVFAQTSIWIKEHVSDKVLVLGYTNGNIGYLPSSDEISQGGYEVSEAHKYYNRPNHYSGDAEENVRFASLKLFESIQTDS